MRMINNWLIGNGVLMVYSVVDGAVIYVCLLIRACMLCVLMFRCSSKKGSGHGKKILLNVLCKLFNDISILKIIIQWFFQHKENTLRGLL